MKKDNIEKLKKLKKKTGWKWSTISTELGINRYTLSRIINRHNVPIQAHMDLIEKYVNRNRLTYSN